MRRWKTAVLLAGAIGFLAAGFPVDHSRASEPEKFLDEVQGRWTLKQQTRDGVVTIVKEHQGRKTLLTAYDAQENILYAHQSEFRVEKSGKVRVFTSFNRTITAGPQAGQAIKTPSSYVYRISQNKFIEVHGVLENDADPPGLIVWDRVMEAPEKDGV